MKILNIIDKKWFIYVVYEHKGQLINFIPPLELSFMKTMKNFLRKLDAIPVNLEWPNGAYIYNCSSTDFFPRRDEITEGYMSVLLDHEIICIRFHKNAKYLPLKTT